MKPATPPPIELEPGEQWARVEIMGHRLHYGKVREVEQFGTKMLRVDVPVIEWTEQPGEEAPAHVAAIKTWNTILYGGSALFSFALVTEEDVRSHNTPSRGALSPLRLTSRRDYDDGEYEVA